MPIPSIPPDVTEAGAVTSPRQLQRWLDINKLSALTRAQTYISVPAFTINTAWRGYSELVGAFNYTALNNFSVKLVQSSLPSAPTYLICIMWEDSANITHRYKLFSDSREVMLFALSSYTGQIIKKNFRIEIWNTAPSYITSDPRSINQIGIEGAGTADVNGIYNQGTIGTWTQVSTVNKLILSGNNSYIFNSGSFNTRYITPNSSFPYFNWTIFTLSGPGGALPVPYGYVPNIITQATEINIMTSFRHTFDYRYSSDVSLASPSIIITNFSEAVNAGSFAVPFVFPTNSIPTLN